MKYTDHYQSVHYNFSVAGSSSELIIGNYHCNNINMQIAKPDQNFICKQDYNSFLVIPSYYPPEKFQTRILFSTRFNLLN